MATKVLLIETKDWKQPINKGLVKYNMMVVTGLLGSCQKGSDSSICSDMGKYQDGMLSEKNQEEHGTHPILYTMVAPVCAKKGSTSIYKFAHA